MEKEPLSTCYSLQVYVKAWVCFIFDALLKRHEIDHVPSWLLHWRHIAIEYHAGLNNYLRATHTHAIPCPLSPVPLSQIDLVLAPYN